MNKSEIKDYVKAILYNCKLGDNGYSPIVPEDAKKGTVTNLGARVSHAYQYLLDIAKEMQFKDFEEVFFVLMTTAYECERSLEIPAIQILSDEAINHTAEIFSQDKSNYLYQIYKLMQEQFYWFLHYRNKKPNDFFTKDFADNGYWSIIADYAKKALTYYPIGEIANRLVCISDIAAPHSSVLFQSPWCDIKKEVDYAKFEKYLEYPRKDFISECCPLIPGLEFEFPIISFKYELGDYEDLKRNLNIYDTESNEIIKNNYIIRILHHAFVNPAIVTVWNEENSNPVIVAVKLARAKKELEQCNKELEQEQKRRENLITSFTHDQKHCIYPKIILEVSEILLKNGDEENASKLYRAYNEVQYQNGSFDNLYSHYLKNSKKILEDFHFSLSPKRGKTIEYLLKESLNLVLLRFLMNDRETADVQTSETLAQWLCIPELRKEYTNLFVIQKEKNTTDITEWFSTHFYPLKIEGIEESIKWNLVRFKKDETAYFTFRNIFINLFHNALNYGKKSLTDGWLRIHFDSIVENGNQFLTIECSNPIEKETAYEEGHGQGITNICERILNLNRYIYPDIDKNYALVTKQENAVFSVKLYFAEALLTKKG